MFKCKDVEGRQIYIGDMVNLWDPEMEEWRTVPGTTQKVEAQVEAIPEEGMVQVNPINLGEIDVVFSAETKISYSLIHNMLNIEDADGEVEKIMKEAEENYQKMFNKKGTKKPQKKAKQTKFKETGEVVEW